jgi:DNA-binding response OmpR family regulator
MPLILVVDDDYQIRSLLQLVLADAGFAVVVASDGSEGIEAALKENPDLIITDAAMPGMDGIEMVKRLRAFDKFEKLPIIMITGGHADLSNQRKLGVDALVLKPLTPAGILAEVRALLGLDHA